MMITLMSLTKIGFLNFFARPEDGFKEIKVTLF